MSGFFRMQVTIPMASGTPQDSVQNVWHFDSDQTFEEDADDVVGRLIAFYQAIDNTLFPTWVGDTGTIKAYDLADPEPRIPHITQTFAITDSGNSTPVPNECAACLSMEAAVISGGNRARRRGRVFLGPVANPNLVVTANAVRLTSSFRSTIVTAAEVLAVGPDPGDARLAVFSPTTAGPAPWTETELAAAFNDVETLWMDNAPDTIRSRGEAADQRTTITVTP